MLKYIFFRHFYDVAHLLSDFAPHPGDNRLSPSTERYHSKPAKFRSKPGKCVGTENFRDVLYVGAESG